MCVPSWSSSYSFVYSLSVHSHREEIKPKQPKHQDNDVMPVLPCFSLTMVSEKHIWQLEFQQKLQIGNQQIKKKKKKKKKKKRGGGGRGEKKKKKKKEKKRGGGGVVGGGKQNMKNLLILGRIIKWTNANKLLCDSQIVPTRQLEWGVSGLLGRKWSIFWSGVFWECWTFPGNFSCLTWNKNRWKN